VRFLPDPDLFRRQGVFLLQNLAVGSLIDTIMSNSIWDHPIETIEKALHIRKQIEALKANLVGMFGDGKQPLVKETAALPSKDGRKGKRSAATIAKMRAAQQARWAKKNGAAVPAVKGTKKKRKFSAASRARMAAAQKARWAKRKIDADVTMPNKLIW